MAVWGELFPKKSSDRQRRWETAVQCVVTHTAYFRGSDLHRSETKANWEVRNKTILEVHYWLVADWALEWLFRPWKLRSLSKLRQRKGFCCRNPRWERYMAPEKKWLPSVTSMGPFLPAPVSPPFPSTPSSSTEEVNPTGKGVASELWSAPFQASRASSVNNFTCKDHIL